MDPNRCLRNSVIFCFVFIFSSNLVFAHDYLIGGGVGDFNIPDHWGCKDKDCCGGCCEESDCGGCGFGGFGGLSGPKDSVMAFAGDPVFMKTGEFTLFDRDLFIRGRSLPIEITRAYNSKLEYNFRFGYGWDINYNLKVRRLDDPNTIVFLNGKVCRTEFTRDVNNPNLYVRSTMLNTYFDYNDVNDTFTLVHKNGTEYHFDEDDKLKSIKDENGNGITFGYEQDAYGDDVLLPINGPSEFFNEEAFGGPAGGYGLVAMAYKLITITDDLGWQTTLSYDANGLLETISDFTNRTWDYYYDPQTNDLLGVTGPATDDYPTGITESYGYDENHNLIYVYDTNDPQQVMVQNYYDSSDKVYKQDVATETHEFDYDPNNNTANITDPEGFESKMVYNETGRILSHTVYTANPADDPNSFTTTYTYNSNMKKIRQVLPAGNCTDYTYDELGHITTVYEKTGPSEPNDANDPNVIATFYTYDPNFDYKVKTRTDAMGNVTTYDYNDITGNLESIIYPTITTPNGDETPVVSYTYDSNGREETVTAPDGMVTKYEYYSDANDANNYGYLWKVIVDYNTVDGLNLTTQYTYDALGNTITETDPNGDTVESQYNALGQLKQTSDPDDNVTKYRYDKRGNRSSIEREIAGPNQVTDYEYNLFNRVETITDPLGYDTTYAYTKKAEPNLVTDAELNATESEYNERGLLSWVTDANDAVTEYFYNENGNIEEIKDANGNSITYIYDGFGRLKRTTYPDNTYEELSYNKNSNTISKTNRGGDTIYYEYDAMNRQIVKNRPGEPNIITRYDIAGRVYDINQAGDMIDYSYDRIGRVASVVDAENNPVSYQYDNKSLRTRLTYPDSNYITYEYDAISRLRCIKDDSNNVVAEYEYDALGRRTLLTLGNDANAVYEYDLGDRLTKLTNNIDDTEIAFEYANYDKVGNRESMKIDDANAHVYTYDMLYQLTNVDYNDGNSTGYWYDDLGNRTKNDDGSVTTYLHNILNQYYSVGGTGYSYDANGNLTNINNGQYEYDYDCENRLIEAKENSQTVATYEYDFAGRRIKKTVDSNTTEYVYDGDQVVAEYENDTLVRKFVYGPGIDEPVCMIDVAGGNAVYYYHFDGLGSVAALSDTSGDIAERYSYDVFGEPNRISDVNNPYFFTGRRYDTEIGNYYYRARYYNTEIGRFLQTDPIGYLDSMNLYAYVRNNPINLIDPMGLMGGAPPLWHSYRNLSNVCPLNEPEDGWIAECSNNHNPYEKEPWWKSWVFHPGRRCYRRRDIGGYLGGSQCCYFMQDGALDDETKYMGTYDIVSPEVSFSNHINIDVDIHNLYKHYNSNGHVGGYIPWLTQTWFNWSP